MNKKEIIMGFIGLIIAVFSTFYYIIYDSWLGVIGLAIALGIIAYNNISRRKEILEEYNKMSDRARRINLILKNILWVVIIICTIAAAYIILIGRIKAGIFNLILLIFVAASQWRRP